MSDYPHYGIVPKDITANIKFRTSLLREGDSDDLAARQLSQMCSEDMLFFINAFLYTYDPRVEPGNIPFITYAFQDEALDEINDAIGSHDLAFKKSRDMGASWMMLLPLLHQWQFIHSRSFLLGSRNEDYVDKPNNPKSLFWKIDFMLRWQPKWLLPNFTRMRLTLQNDDNDSHIDGESTTGDFGRGDRRTAVILDEFAAVDVNDGYKVLKSTGMVTNCRIFNSTPQGAGNAFYDVVHSGNTKTLTLHWSKHPIKAKGLYTSDNNGVVLLDQSYKHEDGYQFLRDGKMRSPWYDREVKRAVHPAEIAQELDIDFMGSDYQFFDSIFIRGLIQRYARKPFLQGDLEHNSEGNDPHFQKMTGGPLSLWCYPDNHGKHPRDRQYVLGIDIAAGTGATNSVISIVQKGTGEKVGEYASPIIPPHKFAQLAVAMARWFNGAYFIWEQNGPGRMFGATVIDLGYRNIFYRRAEDRISRKVSDIPGWFASKDAKRVLYGAYLKALEDGTFTNRSSEALSECLMLVYDPTQGVISSKSIATADPSGARENHADRPTADALAVKGLHESPVRIESEQHSFAPPGSFKARMDAVERELEEAESW